MGRRVDNIKHDDSWLKDIQDVITKPSHTLSVFVDGKDHRHTVRLMYDDGKTVEEIVDKYRGANKPTALNESLMAFLDEVPTGTTVKIIKTNVPDLLSEIKEGRRGLAKRTKSKLISQKIKLQMTKGK